MLTRIFPGRRLGGSTNHGVFIFLRVFILFFIILVVIGDILDIVFFRIAFILQIVGARGVAPMRFGRLFIVGPSATPSTDTAQ